MEEVTCISSEDKTLVRDVGKDAYKPRLAQKVAAVILCGVPLMTLFVNYILPQFFTSRDDILFTFYSVWPSLCYPVVAIGFGLLIKYANNKASRIAMSLATCFYIIYLFNNLMRFAGDIWTLVLSIISFVLVYAYSLILTNNDLSLKSKVWINLLVVFVIYSMSFSGIFSPIYKLSINDAIEAMSWDWMYVRGNHFLMTHIYHFVVIPIFLLLNSAAYYYFACSEVFSGHYDANVKCNYSPLNKWMAAAIIGPLIISLGIFFLYKNYQLFI